MLLDLHDMGPIYGKIPFAGHNELSTEWDHLAGKDLFYARYMLACLDTYEREFARRSAEMPQAKESILHHHALQASGLLDDGLRKARVFAGKFNKGTPGVYYPDPKCWPQYKDVERIAYELRENAREMDRLLGEREALNAHLVEVSTKGAA